MKQKASPAAIVFAVVILALVFFAVYKFTLTNPNQPAITPDNRPEYVKRLQAGLPPGHYSQAAGSAQTAH